MLRCMEACMLHTGYHQVPARKMVWEQLGDCHNPFIANAIRYIIYLLNIIVTNNIIGVTPWRMSWPTSTLQITTWRTMTPSTR